MRKFTINCDAGGSMQPFTIWVGQPKDNHNPLHFQAEWLTSTKGWQIPGNIMHAAEQLHDLSKTENVPLSELFAHVFEQVHADTAASTGSSSDGDNVGIDQQGIGDLALGSDSQQSASDSESEFGSYAQFTTNSEVESDSQQFTQDDESED